MMKTIFIIGTIFLIGIVLFGFQKSNEKQLKKGDDLVFAAFGGGFTWGAIYLKWAYDPK